MLNGVRITAATMGLGILARTRNPRRLDAFGRKMELPDK
jgi:hypothetical protein